MSDRERRLAYIALWVLALAFGWIEGSVVVYLREIDVQMASRAGEGGIAGLQVSLVALPERLIAVEVAREACTLFLIAATAWLAGRRLADRFGAFLLVFGIWDLVYYGVLRAVLGWPDSVFAWDILFLIPLPWVAPVWAPCVVASCFVAAGTHLFFTPERVRRYSWMDASVIVAGALVIVGAFLIEWRAAIDHRVPARFQWWWFWAGVALATGWFVRLERR